jgi:DNA-binding NarL/FixJ family response regulator
MVLRERSFDRCQTEVVIELFARERALSPRETDVLLLAAAGLPRKGAAFRLACSSGTVDTYWRRIFHKLSCSSEVEVFVAILSFAMNMDSEAGASAAQAGD